MQGGLLRIIVVASITILMQANLWGQTSFATNYQPLVHGDTMYRVEVYNHLKARYNFLSDSLCKHAGKEKKAIYKSVFDGTLSNDKLELENNYYLWGDSVTGLLNKILDKIVKANPELKGQNYLLTNRTDEANASSIGDGVLFFNMGLLSRLENEAEIAYVLGHELAHNKLSHVLRGMVKRVETITSKEFKDKVDEAYNSDYNALHKLMQVGKVALYNFNTHGRADETEADSIGMIWAAKAGYAPEYAPVMLRLLDSVDEEKYTDKIDYDKIFSTADFKFKPEWLKGEAFLKTFKAKSEVDKELHNDTLNDHPDNQLRAKTVARLLTRGNYHGTEGTTSLKNTLNIEADFEVIEFEYQLKDYGQALYNTLHLLQVFPNNVYLKAMVGKNLYFLHKSLKDRTFSYYTDMPHPYFSKNYNEFLYFINNMRSSEFAALANSYIKKNDTGQKDKQYEFATILCLSMYPEKTSIENLVAGYTHEYPGTEESKYLTEKLNPLKTLKKN